MALDSWQTEDYDAEQIYTRATDGQGHKDIVHVPMPPYLMNRIGAFVGDAKVIGYRSIQDFMRDAAVHRLHYWGESLPPAPKIAWKTTLARLELDRLMGEIDESEELAVALRAGMERAVRAEQVKVLGGLIETCETHMRDMIEAGQEGAGAYEDLSVQYRGELARLKARRVRT